MIALISGCGANTASVRFALERLNHDVILTQDPEIIGTADHVILPGVGTAQHVMQALEQAQLIDVIKALKQPVLGICVGMQIFYQHSEEGAIDGLGLMSGEVHSLRDAEFPQLTLPHMGWNQIHHERASPLLQKIPEAARFYFVHSYAAPVSDDTVASCSYGRNFSALSIKDNFFGVQFHPERSGTLGSQLLENFIHL